MADLVDVNVVLENDSEFELRWVVFDIPQSSGTYSPMHEILTGEDHALQPGEEREMTISFVESDFQNAGGALIGLGEEADSDNLAAVQGEVVLKRGTNHFKIAHDGETFVITIR